MNLLKNLWNFLTKRIHHHEFVMRFEKHRMYLECIDCGRETTGWNV